MVALVQRENEPLLHAHLIHDVHLVSFAPQRLQIRLTDHAPERFIQHLQSFLKKSTHQHWDIDLSAAVGQPTLAELQREALHQLMEETRQFTLVKSALDAFPSSELIHVEKRKD